MTGKFAAWASCGFELKGGCKVHAREQSGIFANFMHANTVRSRFALCVSDCRRFRQGSFQMTLELFNMLNHSLTNLNA